MKPDPQVSIIIPAYNAAKTIAETLDSVFAQTFSDFEIILINDGSTDETAAIVQRYDDPRLLMFHYTNGGLATARNRGIQKAKGRYLIFLDADDLWTPNKLETHVNALVQAERENPKAAVVYSWSYFLDHQTQQCFHDRSVSHQGHVLREILQHNFITSGSNLMVSRAAVEATGDFCQDFEGAADWHYWIRLAKQWDYVLVPERQVFYRQHATSMSSSVVKMEREQKMALEDQCLSLPSDWQAIKNIGLSNIYFYSAKLYARRSPTAETLAQFKHNLGKALRLNPKLLLQREFYLLGLKVMGLSLLPQRRFEQLRSYYRQLKRPQLNPQSIES